MKTNGREGKFFKLVIFTGYACNNNCVFCVNSEKRKMKPKSTEEILKEIYLAKNKNIDVLELIGGETTIRDDFFTLISAAKKIGVPDIVIATNGRMFADPVFASKAAVSGLGTVIFSVHGHNAAEHDRLTRSPGSFEELKKGMENLKKAGFKNINGNTTVVKGNMKSLVKIAAFYAERRVKNVEFIFVDPNYGGALENFEECVPRISRAAVYMKKALDYGTARGYRQWKARYVPLCHFRGYYGRRVSELNERRLYFTKHSAPDFVNEDVITSRRLAGRAKTSRCEPCVLKNKCEGIWVEYLRRYGDSEFLPVRKK